MRIQLASDLHLEQLLRRFPDETLIRPAHGADVLVLAGDIARGSDAIELFQDWPVPVVYVAGNHEFYGGTLEDVLENLAKRCQDTSIHFLEKGCADFGGVRFLGVTCWTDYRLGGPETQFYAMKSAERRMNDHRIIATRTAEQFLPRDAFGLHLEARGWLKEELAKPYQGKTVVVTHHGPHPGSVHPRYEGDIMNAAFCSDMTYYVKQVDYWFHGHVHDSFDYHVGACRVIANPLGYASNRNAARNLGDLTFENAHFQYACVIDTEQ
jgi:hypothetical protein